ncbi:hypothetical protein [Actinoplanes subtropicus]|uniref:hypothetical protein n=1 Tax=Actinoplanes subtropicus TaxID=543632 RepID=UPI00068F46F7|nr:hypothetical protein [Actinoplanes subtropicus]
MPSFLTVVAIFLFGLPLPAADAGPTFNGGVYTITHVGSVVYLGGSFTSATYRGHSYPRERLAAFDARTGALLSWAPAADGTVRALAATADSIYAAGDFHAVGGHDRDSLARIAPNGDVLPFQHTLTGTAYALATGNGRLYLGGSFAAVDGRRRANLAAFSLATGDLDAAWRPATDDAVHALAAQGSRVYVGGAFHQVDDERGTLRLAAVQAVTGRVDPAFRPKVPAEVRAIAPDPAGVDVATAGVGGRAIAYGPTGVLRWQRVFDGDAAAIVVSKGVTYVGGHFDSACLTSKNGVHGACMDGSVTRHKLAAVTAGGELSTWAPQGNGVVGVRVLSLNRATGVLLAGGDFTTIDGQDRRRLAIFPPSPGVGRHATVPR